MCTRESAGHAILESHSSLTHHKLMSPEVPTVHQGSAINRPGLSISGTSRLDRTNSLPTKQISNPLASSSKRKHSFGRPNTEQSLTVSSYSKSNEPSSTPRALSIEVDNFTNGRLSKRSRKTTSSSTNSSLLIKAYLKNPINPVTCPSLLKNYTRPLPHRSSPNPTTKSSVSLSSHSRSTQLNPCGPFFPPKLNGPFLRTISEDTCHSRRINAMLYGPVDPTLIDPKINNVTYYIYDSAPKDSSLSLSIHHFRYEVFDPAILNSPLVPIRDPRIAQLRPLPITHQFSSSLRNRIHSAAADDTGCQINILKSPERSASQLSFHTSDRDLGSTTTNQGEASYQISRYLDTYHLNSILGNSDLESKESFQEAYLTRDTETMALQSTSSNMHDGDFSGAASVSHRPVYAT